VSKEKKQINHFYLVFFYSYIQDNQIYGDCTPETYIQALRNGCRAVESKLKFYVFLS
jgi:hypothetical protein